MGYKDPDFCVLDADYDKEQDLRMNRKRENIKVLVKLKAFGDFDLTIYCDWSNAPGTMTG